ncbi:hypothetical protein AYO49_00595 [Verrucomicrobiaceae bacterium SCGC AG-212-N21]|nr:hypothetical protein AYO49_00595 [Verrucomicrobiaceae bacterium SCGC AG-212-N21]
MFAGRIVHHGSVLVNVGDEGWKGYVEVFTIVGHHTAKRAFAWKWDEAHCVATLDSPTIQSPLDAVRAALGQQPG